MSAKRQKLDLTKPISEVHGICNYRYEQGGMYFDHQQNQVDEDGNWPMKKGAKPGPAAPKKPAAAASVAAAAPTGDPINDLQDLPADFGELDYKKQHTLLFGKGVKPGTKKADAISVIAERVAELAAADRL